MTTSKPQPQGLSSVSFSPSIALQLKVEARTRPGALPRRLCNAAENSGIQMDKQIQGKGRDLGPRNSVVCPPSAFSVLFVCLPFLALPLLGASPMPANAGNSAMITGHTAVPLYRNGAGERTPVVRPSRSRCTLGSVVFFIRALPRAGPGTGRGEEGKGGAGRSHFPVIDNRRLRENRENAETPKWNC